MKLLFAADMVPTESSEKYYVEGDVAKLFGDVSMLVQGVDRFFVNLEVALTESHEGIEKIGPVLRADPACVNAIKKLGVTDVALSNNHVYDCGEQGLRDTMYHLDKAGFRYFGVGENDTLSRKPYFFEEQGKKIAVVNVCEHEYTYALMQPFFTRNEELKTDAWLEGWRAFCETQREYFKARLRLLANIETDEMATQYLAHYLACEAHTDVLKELFQTWHKTK